MPQTGLNEADIVFEQIINDGVTRFVAVFHSQGSDPVGPIRSGRAQDVDILTNLDSPLFAWSGGNEGVTGVVNNSSLVSLNYVRGFADAYFRRDGRGGAPHNLFSSTDALWVAPETLLYLQRSLRTCSLVKQRLVTPLQLSKLISTQLVYGGLTTRLLANISVFRTESRI